MRNHPFHGEFWNTNPKTEGFTHFRFYKRKDTLYVSTSAFAIPTDIEWGETPLLLLKNLEKTPSIHRGFATWRYKPDHVHMLFTVTNKILTVESISILTGASYYESETFKKNPVRARAARKANPLDRFAYMWDGSQRGWQLAKYNHPVYFVTFEFGKAGPSLKVVSLLKDYLHHKPFRSKAREREYWKGCEAFGTGPFGPAAFKDIQKRRKAGKFRIRVIKIEPGDLLPVSPVGGVMGWNLFPNYRRPFVEKMLAAKIPVVFRTLK